MEYHWRDATMHYVEEGEGPAVLLLHGWGCSTEIWVGLRPALAQRFRVIAVDFPGFGRSSLPGADWGMAEYAALIRDFVAERGLAGCHVLGHSFGGRVVFKMAEQPLPFDHVLLTGAAGLRPEPSGKKSAKSTVYQALKSVALSGPAKALLGEKKQAEMREELIQRFGSADYKALAPLMRGVFVRVINEDLSPQLPGVDRPTLLMWGEDDRETPLWMGQRMEKDIPDAALLSFDGAGHYLFLDRPLEFARIAINFFGGE